MSIHQLLDMYIHIVYTKYMNNESTRKHYEHMDKQPQKTRRFRYARRLRMTGKAILVEDSVGQHWLPNSQSWHRSYASDGSDEGFYFVDLPLWLDKQKNMADEITGQDLDLYRIVS